jgi:Family of unknown function (DUF6516)
VTAPRGSTLDVLHDLDGQVLVVDPVGGHWVRFTVTRVPASPEKPHGIDYSLTLHGPDGERLVGFDNAHLVARQKCGEPQDHRHRLGRSGPTSTGTRRRLRRTEMPFGYSLIFPSRITRLRIASKSKALQSGKLMPSKRLKFLNKRPA